MPNSCVCSTTVRRLQLGRRRCGKFSPWKEWHRFSPVLRPLTSPTRNITPRWPPPSESISFSLSLNAIGAPLAKLQNDLSEFIALLNSSGVEYLVVGGHAVAFHGHPRLTGDIDFFVRPTQENGARILNVLNQFGFGQLALHPEDFTTQGQVVQLGRPPNRIDLLTSISGVGFRRRLANTSTRTPRRAPCQLSGLRCPHSKQDRIGARQRST